MIKKILVRPKLFAQLSLLSPATRALYDKALQRFVDERGHGLNLEKLQGGLYSIRVNQLVRLILTPQKHKEEQVWLWIETLEDHKYQELLKKPSSWLNNQIITTLDVGIELNSSLAPEIAGEDSIVLEQEAGISYHNQQFIILDTQQQQIQQHPLPLIISGAPGSGKTSIALFMLAQFIHALKADDESKTLLYLAQSESLVNYMRDGWQDILELEFPELKNCDVQFKTPLQLCNERLAAQASTSEHSVTLVNYAQFTPWLSSYIKKHNRSKIAPAADEWLIGYGQNPELIYQEFRTISGYHQYTEYDGQVGARFSLFIEPEGRQWLWHAYHYYMDYLNQHKLLDLSFHPINVPYPVDFLIADEAADFSGIQLRSLPNLVQKNQLALCIGDHQRVLGSESIVPFVKYVFWQANNKQHLVHHEVLRSSYRNPAQVVLLANAALQLKFKANKSSLIRDHSELSYINSIITHQGDIHWLANEQELTPLINDNNNADFAVITCVEFLTEAQEKFGMERVLTPEGIKGLQYKHILIYRLLEQNDFKAANQVIGDHCELKANPDEFILPKNNEGTIVHNRIFNELFVAITRAQHSVSIFQPESSSIRYIRKALMQFIKNNSLSATHAQAIPTHSSIEDWQQRGRQLTAHQQNEQAQAINERLSKKVNKPLSPPTTRMGASPSASPPQSSKKSAIASVNAHYSLIKRIIGGDFSAIKPLLKQQQALNYLFKTPLTVINPSFGGLSLFTWFVNSRQINELSKAVHALLKELEPINNPSVTQKAEINTFMELIHFVPSTPMNRMTQLSLISHVTNSITLHKKISRFIAQYKITPSPTPKPAPLISELYPAMKADALVVGIPQTPLVHYSLYCAPLLKSDAATDLYLQAIVDNSCPSPLPEVFFRVLFQERQLDARYKLFIKLDPIEHAGGTRVPIRLRNLLHTHNAPKPTLRQLIHLLVAISHELDQLDPSLTFWPSLDSIFITHLNDIGSDKPLSFKFCPVSLKSTRELPPGTSRATILHRQMASIFLLIAAGSDRLDDPALAFKARHSLTFMPALATIFFELWQQALPGATMPSNQLLTMSSPTLRYLSIIMQQQLKKAKIHHIPAILSILPIITTFKMADNLMNSLYRLAAIGEKKNRGIALGLIANSIEIIIELLAKDALPEETQETILKVIVLIFEHLEHSGDYAGLRQLQHRLMEQSMLQLLDKFKEQWYSEIHISAIQVLIWLAFQCEAVSIELLMPARVRAMTSTLLLAINDKWLEQSTGHKYIIMLLILSDFAVWLEPKIDYNYDIEQIWHEIEPEIFITYGLSCYFNALSTGTTVAIIKKLEALVTQFISNRDGTDAVKEQQLEQCLNYLLFLQWNGEEQLNAASYRSQQEVNRAAMIFKKSGHALLIRAPTFSHQLALSNPLQNMFAYLAQLQPKNHANHQLLWKYFKEPITKTDLAEVATTHAEPMDAHYLPCPDPFYTHSSKNAVELIFPDNGMIRHYTNISSNLSRIYSTSAKRLAQQKSVFIPTTLSTRNPMYTLRHHSEEKGTRAMFELYIDTVRQPNLVIGITWNRTLDSDVTPGNSPTSLGFVFKTGCIRYYSATGQQVEVPYARPCNPGDKIALGIANSQVYLNINGLFYPLIDNLTLPAGDIYPLIQVNDPGCHLILDMMNSLWSNTLNDASEPIYSTSNIVANSLYDAHEEASACPHYHTLFDTCDTDESFYKVTFHTLIKTPQLIAALPQEWQRSLLLILLAHQPCNEEHCHAQDIFTKLKTVPAKDYHKEPSLAPVNLANLLGFEQLVLALRDGNRSGPNRYKGTFFNQIEPSSAVALALNQPQP